MKLKQKMTLERDFVCGMVVEVRRAAAQAHYRGRVYYFCGPSCALAFGKEPEKYVLEPFCLAGQAHADR